MEFQEKTFGQRYKLTEKIGTGGMADVFKATDIVLNRQVALKVLHPQYAQDESFVARFRREAQAAANLNHPNIVNVYDWGKEGDTYFIAMEFVKGRSLKEIIREKGGLSPEDTIEIAKQVCSALNFAHENEVIHRDIKPHNIILTEEGRVKVTDFGIARAGTSSLTETGAIMGTVYYLAPEQAQGLPANETSDLYSLGVVMYEMVTGKIPFDGDSAIAIALKHVHEEPIPPSYFNSKIPSFLENIILRALAKDPFDRYQSAHEMLDDLVKAEKGLPITETKKSTSMMEKTLVIKPPPKPREKRKSLIWATIFVFFLTFLALGSLLAFQIILIGNRIEVPPVEGKSFEAAKRILEKKGLKIKIVGKEYSEIIEAGHIISQDPEPGRKLKKGEIVRVVLSKGKELIEVPDLAGKTEAEAGSLLGEKKLKVGEIERVFSDTVPEGIVISQEPKSGEKVEIGTPVNLKISQGVELVIVPDVLNKNSEEATKAVSKAGLKYSLKEEFNEEVEIGRVIRQTPQPGIEVKKGSTVEIVVSKGPETVTVPDVIGKSNLEARSELEALRFEVETIFVSVSDQSQIGKVVAQSPTGNSQANKGTTVTIWVGQ